MDTSEDLMTFYTPEKTSPTTIRHNNSSIDESFHEVKDVNAFFQPARLFDIDNRESLMLLKNLDEIDITRKSLGISRDFLGLGTESIDLRRESIDLRRESINLRRESIDFGRESLGILTMNAIDDEFNNSTLFSISANNVLNKGMLYSHGRSINSSVSALVKTPLKSLNESCDYPEVFSPTPLKHKNNVTEIFKDVNLGDNVEEDKKDFNGCPNFVKEALVEFDKKMARSFRLGNIIEEDDKKFNDSILMEARVLASKMKDNSVFEENGEICALESTCQPTWLIENYEEISKNEEKPEEMSINEEKVEEISKNEEKPEEISIDQKPSPITPISYNQKPLKIESETKCDAINSTNNSDLTPNTTKRSETYENISKIFQNKSISSRISCSSNVSSKDAKEILENLSEILLSENPTNEQKSEGQNLLYNLADMLFNSRGSSKRESSDDSGHSSIENDQENNQEQNAAIIRKKLPEKVKEIEDKDGNKIEVDENKVGNDENKVGNDENKVGNDEDKVGNDENEIGDDEKPLDLSLNGNKRPLNRSLSCPGPAKVPAIVPKVLKNCRVSIPSTLKTLNVKLKPKKIEEKKKGPMKAILPLGNMAKVFNKQNKVNCTPPKIEGSSIINKILGTPKNDSNIRPVAQSTPDETTIKQKVQNSPSQLPKPKFSSPVSPLARPSNFRELSSKLPRTLTDSTLNKNKFSPVNTMNRRKSSSDIKTENQPVQRIQRSNSISKDVKPSVTNLCLDKKRLKSVGIKGVNLVSKIRKSAGKENLPQ